METTTPAVQQHFVVDKEGLAKIMRRRGPGFAVYELLSNAWDEDVSRVDLWLDYYEHREWGWVASISVQDDAPEGFKDLSHAYTLFAESAKKGDAEKRGRFNLGEKLVIAICEEAVIETTTGTVIFDADGRRHDPDRTRDAGSIFRGFIRMTKDEYEETVAGVHRLIPPPHLVTYLNGNPLPTREPVAEFQQVLATEAPNDSGELRRTFRKATIRLYEPIGDEKAAVYELGVPVVETGDRWHADVSQKVPVNLDRDNLPPAWLRILRRAILDNTIHLLTPDIAQETWVTAALEDPQVSPEAVQATITQRFGEKVVSHDMSDPEANKIATSEGYTVLSSRMLPKPVWAHVREHGIVKPAGQVTPSPKAYDPGKQMMRATVKPSEWTDGMKRLSEFVNALATRVLDGRNVEVEYVNDPGCMNFSATYLRGHGHGSASHFEFNYRVLGRKWFDRDCMDEDVLSLVIHEFGHEYSRDHLDRAYLNALTDIGARVATLALDDPTFFAPYRA